MALTKDEAVELFMIKTRGAVAAAFDYASLPPDKKQWEMLRGEAEITMRDMGEIGFHTITQFNLSFQERLPREKDAE